MRTRAQRRNMISRWFSTTVLLTGGVTVAVGLWAFGDNRAMLAAVARQAVTPDADLPVLVDEDSLDIARLGRIEDSVSRPLWAVTRRPYVAPPPPKELPQELPKAEPPKVIPPLEGVLNSVILTGQLKIIFMQTAEGVLRLEEGMSYNGWQLRKINEDSAEFHFDEEQKVLQLRTFATVDTAPARLLGDPKQ